MPILATRQANGTALELPGAIQAPNVHIGGDPDEAHPTPFGANPPDEWLSSLPVNADGEMHDPYDHGAYIDADGRVAILAWPYDRCHIGYTDAGECWIPPVSPTGNQMFHQGRTITASGVSVPTGGLLVEEGHISEQVTVAQAMQLYNNPELFGASGRILDIPGYAAYFVGYLMPGVTNQQVANMRAGALSGDWRFIPELGMMDALGPVLVGRPGLPSHDAANKLVDVDAEFWALAAQFETDVTAGAVTSARQSWVWIPIDQEDATMKTETAALGMLRRQVNKARQAAGISFETRRDQISAAVEERFGSDDLYTWVKDFDDNQVIFEAESEATQAIGYSMDDDGNVTLVGDPVDVQITYEPITTTTNTDDAGSEEAVAASGSCGCKKQAKGTKQAAPTDQQFSELAAMVMQIGEIAEQNAQDIVGIQASMMESAQISEETANSTN